MKSISLNIVLSFSAVILLAFPCSGQRRRGTNVESVSYTINKDNPDYKSLSLNFGIGFGISEVNGFMFPVESCITQINQRYTGELGGTFNFRFNSLNPAIRSVYEPEIPRDLNLLFSIVAKSNKKIKDVPVLLKQGYYYSEYVNVPLTVDNRFNIDLGFSAGSSWTSLNYSILNGSDINDNVYTVGNGEAYFSDFYSSTYYNFGRLRFGFSYSKHYYFDVDVDHYGNQSAGSMSKFYGHFLFDFYNNFDDINVLLENGNIVNDNIIFISESDEEVYLQLNINEKMNYNPFGYAVGYKTIGISESSIYINIETGLTPGVRTEIINKLFVRLSFGLSFSTLLE